MKEKFSKKDLEKLREDEHYYGAHGKKFLSNSDISTLLTNPLALGESMKPIPPFLIGGYFHTAILEPEKLKNFKVIDLLKPSPKPLEVRKWLKKKRIHVINVAGPRESSSPCPACRKPCERRCDGF